MYTVKSEELSYQDKIDKINFDRISYKLDYGHHVDRLDISYC